MSDRILMVTGHRPPKIGGYDNYEAQGRLKTHMCHELERISPDKGRSGFALGIDQIFAQACIDVGVPLIADIPFEGQDSRWPEQSQIRYRDLLSKAHEVNVISDLSASSSPHYGDIVKALHARNHHMADTSSHALGYWNQITHGGTFECITYLRHCLKDPDHSMQQLTIHNPTHIIKMSEKEWLENLADAREEQKFHETGGK